jgi:DNA-binding response OmpR family regulator
MNPIILPTYTPPPPLVPFSATDQIECAGPIKRVAAGKGKRLLVVDDDPSTVNALRSLLRASGHEVITASTVAEAISAIDASIDSVILDLMLPDGDGSEVLRRMRSAGLKARVCVTTGVSSPAWLSRVNQLGADCILAELLEKL